MKATLYECSCSNQLRGIIQHNYMWQRKLSIIEIITFHLIDSSAIANLLDVIEAPQNNAMNEKMAINAIQNALMSYETAVNPTSSTITMPGTPPAYSTAVSAFFDPIINFELVLLF